MIYVKVGEYMKNCSADALDLKEKIKNFLEKAEKEIIFYNEFSLQHELGIYLREELGENYIVEFERNVTYFDIKQLEYNEDFKKAFENKKQEFKEKKHISEEMFDFCKFWDVIISKGNNKEILKYHSNIKHEIDISIYKKINGKFIEKYAIELKYPTNGQIPERMYEMVRDIKFMQELKNKGFTKTFCLTIVTDDNYYEQKRKYDGIYEYFRGNERKPLINEIYKPTGEKNELIGKKPFINLKEEAKIEWVPCKIKSSRYNDKTIDGCYYIIDF